MHSSQQPYCERTENRSMCLNEHHNTAVNVHQFKCKVRSLTFIPFICPMQRVAGLQRLFHLHPSALIHWSTAAHRHITYPNPHHQRVFGPAHQLTKGEQFQSWSASINVLLCNSKEYSIRLSYSNTTSDFVEFWARGLFEEKSHSQLQIGIQWCVRVLKVLKRANFSRKDRSSRFSNVGQ